MSRLPRSIANGVGMDAAAARTAAELAVDAAAAGNLDAARDAALEVQRLARRMIADAAELLADLEVRS